ncbi:MAG TPA: prepilin-type N-terminal cleavage/methylation domain-containing protein [Mycobacteriales bacterium]|jgi:prepilin-type N-terminal cleavage/methylation domain-containing protein|nr:prepilin-type N-terminal cleavage/methylation domain-containing protein [Mycobacteriales bacterium]
MTDTPHRRLRRAAGCLRPGERRRRRLAGDEGFTLPEMMVALMIIGLVLLTTGGALITSVVAQRLQERNVRGTQLGNAIVEQMRALPWDSLGFYASDSGYTATYQSRETVTLAEVSPHDSRVPSPAPYTVTQGGISYTAQVHVVWEDDASDGTGAADTNGTHDFKHVYVDLSWLGAKATRSVSVEGTRAPTIEEVAPAGQAAVTPFVIKSYAATPTTSTIDGSGLTTATLAFSATTSTVATSMTISYKDRNNTTKTLAMSAPAGTGSTWTASLPTGSGPFNSGSVTYSLAAVGPLGAAASSNVSVSYSVSTTPSFNIDTHAVSPSSVQLDAAGYTTQQMTVTVHTTTPASAVSVKYAGKTGTSAGFALNSSDAGQTWTKVFPVGTGPFNSGGSTFTVTGTSQGGATAQWATTVTMLAASATPVAIVGVTVSPTPFCVSDSAYTLWQSTIYYIGVSGVSSTDVVDVTFNDDSKTSASLTNGFLYNGYYVFQTTLPTTMKWSAAGTALVASINARRVSDNTQTPGNYSTTIKRTSKANQC